MNRLTLINGTFDCDCVCQNGIWLTPCDDPMCNVPTGYLTGRFKPNYPVPAIYKTMQWSFEWPELLIALR